MPTPQRRADGGTMLGCDNMGASKWTWGTRRGRSREGPPASSAVEAACDQRSAPQDVTRSSTDAQGSICSQRSRLTRPKDLPCDSPNGDSPNAMLGAKGNIQADRGGI